MALVTYEKYCILFSGGARNRKGEVLVGKRRWFDEDRATFHIQSAGFTIEPSLWPQCREPKISWAEASRGLDERAPARSCSRRVCLIKAQQIPHTGHARNMMRISLFQLHAFGGYARKGNNVAKAYEGHVWFASSTNFDQ